jgi:hypothetical protein
MSPYTPYLDHSHRRLDRQNKLIQDRMLALERGVWPKVTTILDRLDKLAAEQPYISLEKQKLQTAALRIETAILRHTIEQEVRKIREVQRRNEDILELFY